MVPSSPAAKGRPTFAITQPTIIAFFPPISSAELSADNDTNETLADFQWYAKSARQSLAKRGIEFKEVYANSFRIRVGSTVTIFRPTKSGVGYYLIAPGKRARIEYEVMTDTELLQVADDYFSPPAQLQDQ
jgi:hypothetical protein